MHDPSLCSDVQHGRKVGLHESRKMRYPDISWNFFIGKPAIVMWMKSEQLVDEKQILLRRVLTWIHLKNKSVIGYFTGFCRVPTEIFLLLVTSPARTILFQGCPYIPEVCISDNKRSE